MTPNSTSLLASLGTSIRDISFYRKNHYEYLQYPALIVSHKIEVKNCKFAGYNYCVGLTPVYIDSLLFESISQMEMLQKIEPLTEIGFIFQIQILDLMKILYTVV